MIVTVAGGKGGIGKSTTSWNLARELDAIVVDADLTGADLPPGTGPDLHDVLAGRADPVEAAEEFGEVTLLPCGRSLSGARASNLDNLMDTLNRVEREWGSVVVDSPAGLARDVGLQLQAADLAVFVTAPDRAALVDLLRTCELAEDLETPVASLILNKAHQRRHEDLAERLSRILGVDVTIVEKQDAVANAQANWKPVRDYNDEAQAVRAYTSVANRLRRAQRRMTERPGSL